MNLPEIFAVLVAGRGFLLLSVFSAKGSATLGDPVQNQPKFPGISPKPATRDDFTLHDDLGEWWRNTALREHGKGAVVQHRDALSCARPSSRRSGSVIDRYTGKLCEKTQVIAEYAGHLSGRI